MISGAAKVFAVVLTWLCIASSAPAFANPNIGSLRGVLRGAGEDKTLDLWLWTGHHDFAIIPKTSPLNSLEVRSDQGSDLYSLGACD